MLDRFLSFTTHQNLSFDTDTPYTWMSLREPLSAKDIEWLEEQFLKPIPHLMGDLMDV